MKQEEINRLLVEQALQGKIVTRLKGGDPTVFGRGGEEAEALRREGIEFEIVPGVTSAIAVPAYAGIPVTHRDLASSVSIITGHENPEKLDELIRWDRVTNAAGHARLPDGRRADRPHRAAAHPARTAAGHAGRPHPLGHDGPTSGRSSARWPTSRRR